MIEFVRKIDNEVENVKSNKKWRVEYMTLLMKQQEARLEGRAEGKLETARKFLENGIPMSEVVAITGLSEKELLQDKLPSGSENK